ncbi:outer membrane beta-barrel family protein [Pedobacter endophyticus]|uniref:TonB-dependent receptor n=1 Tax=Pedobacter endophyticus TaxID=2789740 RepID=A0A7U3Q408_9SPHI|nr:outer membrane beta-barrel family protein [Pedobacter endophyticus]QPH38200.1 TonB-dependent receptor [Pedobacter endophyticus]
MPIKFANISLIDSAGKAVQLRLSDENGKCSFVVSSPMNQKLRLYTAPFGFKEYYSKVLAYKSGLNQDTIFLSKEAIVLQEVKIYKQQTIQDGEKLIYRPKLDQFSSTKTIVQLLPRLPGVALVSGKLKLNGNDGVLLLIDGKGELVSQSQQIEMLRTLSADKIEKIEIIQTPSARYDSNITSVIDIITKKEKGSSTVRVNLAQPFFMDNQTLGVDFLSTGASANFNFNVGGIRTSILFRVHNAKSFEDSEFKRIIYDLLSYTSITNLRSSRFSLAPNIILDYDINSRSSIGISTDLSFVPSLTRNTFESYRFFDITSNMLDSVVVIENRFNNKRSTIQLNGNYRYIFNTEKKSTLYLNFIYSVSPYKVNNELNKPLNGIDQVVSSNKYNSASDIVNASLIISDLVKSRTTSTDFGFKFNTLSNSTEQFFGADKSNFVYQEQLSSIFSSWKTKLGKYLIIAGIRGELLNSHSTFDKNGSMQTLNQDYFKVYPNFLIQKNLSNNFTTSIGFSKKIRRPFLNQLNPSSHISSFVTSTAGNINYKPIFSNKFEAQLRHNDIGLTVYYEQSSGNSTYLPTDDPFVNQVVNLNKLHKFAFSGNKGFKISSFFSCTVNANYSYSRHEDNDVRYYKNGLNLFEMSASSEITLSKKTQIQADFYYQAKMNLEYTVYSPFFSHSLTLRQLLLKDKWSLSSSLNDPLGLEKNRSKSFFSNQFSSGWALTNQRSVSVQIVYNFPFGHRFENRNYKKKNDGEIRDQQ